MAAGGLLLLAATSHYYQIKIAEAEPVNQTRASDLPSPCPTEVEREYGFGCDAHYTVIRHEMLGGRTRAVVSSPEENVEIWSSVPEIVQMADGRQFHFVPGTLDFGSALRIDN